MNDAFLYALDGIKSPFTIEEAIEETCMSRLVVARALGRLCAESFLVKYPARRNGRNLTLYSFVGEPVFDSEVEFARLIGGQRYEDVRLKPRMGVR